MIYFLFWVLVVSAISVVITVYDKYCSKYDKHRRVAEQNLFLFALLGGSAAMFFTMIIIRHKTRHMCFMIGLPVIMLAQFIGIFLLLF